MAKVVDDLKRKWFEVVVDQFLISVGLFVLHLTHVFKVLVNVIFDLFTFA